MLANKKKGKWKEFDENGNKALKGRYASGAENGLFIKYYQNGQKESDGKIINEKLIGEWVYYSPEGDTLEIHKFPE